VNRGNSNMDGQDLQDGGKGRVEPKISQIGSDFSGCLACLSQNSSNPSQIVLLRRR
jgi:hypothetical protein